MDISTLFWGSGFALFIAMLAWGNRIREPRRDVKELETLFIKNFETDKRTIRPLVKESYESLKKSPIEGFLETIDSLVEIMDNIKSKEDVEVIEKFKEVDKLRKTLEKFYKIRYISSLLFTFFLFLLGVLSFYIGNIYLREPFLGIMSNQIYMFMFIIFVFIILTIIGIIYFLEEKFIVMIDETDDLLEVK